MNRLPSLLVLCCLPLAAEPVRVTAGETTFELASPEQGLGLLKILNGNQARYVDQLAPAALWELIFRGPAGEVRVTNNSPCERVAARGGVLTWTGVKAGESTVADVTVRFSARGDELHGRIDVRHRSNELILGQVDFPVTTLTPTPSPAEQITLVFSRAEGRSWRDPFHGPAGYLVGAMEPYGLDAPGPFQFGLMVDDAEHGLYWATHDPDGYHKKFSYTNDPASATIAYRIKHYPGGQDQPGNDYALPYPVVLKAFDGDWWDGAMIYRRWSQQQVWLSRGKLKDRRDVPRWVKDTQVWVRGDSKHTSPAHRACLESYRELFGTPLGVQWYNWHEGRNWMDPWRWPPKEGVVEQFKELQGVYALPYVNVLQWDTTRPEFKAADGTRGAILAVDGQPLKGAAEQADVAYHMCAASRLWQDELTKVCVRLVKSGGAAGVYLDQLGNQAHQECYAKDHGHPVGGGCYGTAGLRELLTKVRTALRQVSPEAVVYGESQQDSFIDVCDGRLNHYNVWPGWVDLWAVVCGDYTLSFGRTISQVGLFADDAGFTARIANNLVSGVAFGRVWISGGKNAWGSPDLADKLRYFQTAIAYRKAFADYLVYGHHQRPLHFLTKLPDVKLMDAKQRPMTMPAVIGNAFSAADGSLGVIVANLSTEPQAFELALDLTRHEVAQGQRYALSLATPDGRSEPLATSGPQIKQAFRLAGWQIALVVIRRAG